VILADGNNMFGHRQQHVRATLQDALAEIARDEPTLMAPVHVNPLESLLQQNLSLSVAPASHLPVSGTSPLGLSSSDLLVAAAVERKMLEQARLSAQQRFFNQLKAAADEKTLLLRKVNRQRVLNQSLLSLLQTPSSVRNLSTLMQHAPVAPSKTEPSKEEVKETLEVLGNSLRKKNDAYVDVTSMVNSTEDHSARKTRGGVTEPFPEKLHRMLREVEEDKKTDVISFYSHSRAFGVHDAERFVSEVMPKYFKQSRLSSFHRQLNLYGFHRITSGPDAGGYYHELFLKGRVPLCHHMRRVGVPQGGDRRKQRAKNVVVDPDFYSMPKLPESSEL